MAEFTGGLNAYKKPKGKEWEEGATRIFGKGKYDDVEIPKDFDPFARFKQNNKVKESSHGIEIKQAEPTAEEQRKYFAHEIVQPIENGKPNHEFYKHYGQKAMDNALKDLGYK